VSLIEAGRRPTVVVAAATTWRDFPSLWDQLLGEVWDCVQADGQTWQQHQSYAQPYAQSQYGQSQYGQQQSGQPQYQLVQTYEPHQPAAGTPGQRRTGLTGAQQFWYVLQCIAFGAGYFAKLPTAKALSEMPQFRSAGY